ncbi:hypothetical protein O181_092923 [Austropuccinia psidii MF-1]|uniref:Uncharacterized protein n=1 Tax=Austropuccinia psidii MF-1 TaxID=1389203 RepID=A0A9Q3IZF6_9BASI|nr:hypothetical protein [Austropuccinia psidii MF-1]
MGQALLKEVPKLKEWPHFSGEGEYDHKKFIRGIDIINKDFELPEIFVTVIFNTFLPKDRLTELYPDLSEFMIHRKILRQCGDELTTRIKIGSTRVNLKTRLNTPWKDSVDKNPKENSNNKYKSSDTVRKCHICQSTTHLANTCPKRGEINEIDIEKEPDVKKDDTIEDNSDDKSSIFSESSKDIENTSSAFEIIKSYSHLPQLSNGQLDLSKVQFAQLMKTKPSRGKGYTACNSCITEVVINNKPNKILLDPGAFCSCVGKSFLKTCVPNFQDQLLPIDCIKFNSTSNPMKALGIFETNIIFPHINGNLRITVEFFVMENCSSTHFILGNHYLIMYGRDLNSNKDRYFTIGDNKCQKFAFLPLKRQITLYEVSPVNLELEKFKSEQLREAEISLHLTDKQENELSSLLYDHKGAFASDKEPLGAIIEKITVNEVSPVNLDLERFKSEQLNEAEVSLHLTDKEEIEASSLLYDHKEAFSLDKEPLGAIIGHEVDIILNIERPYPPLLTQPAYPASPKSREALEINIKEILDLGVIGKVGHNEEVEITTPVIVHGIMENPEWVENLEL